MQQLTSQAAPALLCALLLTISCADDTAKMALPQAPEPIQGLAAVAEAPTDAPPPKPQGSEVIRATATALPLRSSRVASGAAGRILSIEIQEGQQVAQGQPLMRLDVRTSQLQASQAGSSAEAAQVNVRQLNDEVEKVKALVEQGAVPKAQLDQLEYQRDYAVHSLRAAQGSVKLARKGVGDGVITAPFAGTIVEIPVEVGEMATPGGAPVVRLLDLSSVELRAQVHERELPRLAVGSALLARFPSVHIDRPGVVERIGVEVDPATRTVEVITHIPNPDGKLFAGMFVELEIQARGAGPSGEAAPAAPAAP